jgi:nucleoside-diphosphate-sugar epimerase
VRVLVTGAAGFVGSSVARTLVRSGHEVYAAVREPGSRLDDVIRDVRLERADLAERTDVQAVVARVRPELCIHCAWFAVPGAYLQSPLNDVHRRASLDLARALAAHGCGRLVGLGTCFEYELGPAPLSEASPLAPLTPYAQSKLATCLELDEICAASGMSFGWARLFYLYGPHEDTRRLVPAVTLSLLEGRPARTTSGEQLRDFLHVDDVASAVCAVAGSRLSGPVNIASGTGVPVREIVLQLGEITGRPDLIEFGALEPAPGDPPVVVADNRLLVEACDWAPAFTLEDGLRQTVDWWRNRRAA